MKEVPSIYYQLQKGLQSLLYDYGIFHLDIKMANCLYNPVTKSVKICDFGLTMMLGGKSPEEIVCSPKMNWGTAPYFSPERSERRIATPSELINEMRNKYLPTRCDSRCAIY